MSAENKAMASFESAFPKGSLLKASTIHRIRKDRFVYLIFLVARSGSTWLTEMAINGNRLGACQEWFNAEWIQTEELSLNCKPPRRLGTFNINSYVQRIADDYRSSIELVGAQISYYQMLELASHIDNPALAIRDMPIFYLRRENIVAQAISLYRSVKSGIFHSYQLEGQAEGANAAEYDLENIRFWVEHLLECENGFEKTFEECGLSPRRFFYEDLVKDPRTVLSWIEQEVTGVPHPSIEVPQFSLSRMSGAESMEWEERFRSEAMEFCQNVEARRRDLSSDIIQ